jgi:DNA-binding CsgD family transcriptional regulator
MVDGDAPLPAARSLHASGLAAEDGRRIADAASAFEACGALLLAAEAHAEAARYFRTASLTGAAVAAERTSTELAARCPGARTPALSAPVEPMDALTGREREIAVLAAKGLISKEIAARLSVAVRTVDNHLQRVYTKLGVNSREELSQVLEQ